MKFIFVLSLALLAACKPSKPTSEQAASASSTATATSDATRVGSVRGIVRIRGDESPLMPKAAQIPVGQCFAAHKMHSKVFRRGANDAAADVLVAVTEYSADVPRPTTPVEVRMEDCALSQRTIVMTPGQQIHARNTGIVAAIPHLQGAPQAALVVAVPGGAPIVLTPIKPGRYLLVDSSHEYATADVFVLNYPTADVTDEEGKFEITGVPVGDVKLSARLPDAGLTVERRVTIEANKTTEVELELRFDRAQWQATVDAARRQLDTGSTK